MLTHIHIQHFAIVESLALDFQMGLQVLTGETGAGKSIWVDALQIGLGERADASVIFSNATRCSITLCFDLSQLEKAKRWLATQDIDATDECIVHRVIYADKPSRTTINGIPVPQALVKELSHYLLCIHSQHQHQQLLKHAQQRHLLDQYANNDALIKTIHQHYLQWKTLEDKLTTLQSQAQSKSANLALWEYQLTEIKNLALEDNEFQETFSQYQKLHQSKNVLGALNKALFYLSNEDDQPSASSLLSHAQRCIDSISEQDEMTRQVQTALETAHVHIIEASETLSQFCNDTDFQLSQLDQMEKRLNQIQMIARKHNVEPEALSLIEHDLETQIQALENVDNEIAHLKKQQVDIVNAYQTTAATLTNSRKKAAKAMEKIITDDMQSLGMPGGKCEIHCNTQPDGIYPFGNESVSFLVATNPGQKPQALSQHVSGGELSRLSLICHVLTAQAKNTPTLIFDEVDVGIGGKTADVVGKLLRELGKHAQVLCITHLPQVAANGHHHFKAEKITDKHTAITTIKPLDVAERREEIARMLSGATITEKSLSHATELLTIED